jgi:signal transduction histidine kinase
VIQAFQSARAEKGAQYRYLQTVVQHIGVGILVYRHDGTVDMINQSARRLFKMSRMKHLDELGKLDSAMPQAIQKLKSGEKSRIQFMDTDSGSPMDLSLHASQFVIRNERMTLVSIQNIQSELEEKELEAWQNLIRVLTHEIMNSLTPIASLAATASSLLPAAGGDNDTNGTTRNQDVAEALQTIDRRSRGLMRFVQAYRSVALIPRPQFRIFLVRELFQRLETLLQDKLLRQGIALTTEVEPPSLEITADPDLTEQVLLNLLLNAMEALAGSKTPRIHLSSRMNDRGRVVIQVSDNGPGIAAEAREKIFIPFFTTKKTGSGVGLSFSRQVMRLHGGVIGVQSQPASGTVFTLRF